MVNSLMNTGVQGVQSGMERANQAATDIALATAPDAQRGDPVMGITEAAVELKVAKQQVVASTEVIRSADEMLGTLIDTSA